MSPPPGAWGRRKHPAVGGPLGRRGLAVVRPRGAAEIARGPAAGSGQSPSSGMRSVRWKSMASSARLCTSGKRNTSWSSRSSIMASPRVVLARYQSPSRTSRAMRRMAWSGASLSCRMRSAKRSGRLKIMRCRSPDTFPDMASNKSGSSDSSSASRRVAASEGGGTRSALDLAQVCRFHTDTLRHLSHGECPVVSVPSLSSLPYVASVCHVYYILHTTRNLSSVSGRLPIIPPPCTVRVRPPGVLVPFGFRVQGCVDLRARRPLWEPIPRRRDV